MNKPSLARYLSATRLETVLLWTNRPIRDMIPMKLSPQRRVKKRGFTRVSRVVSNMCIIWWCFGSNSHILLFKDCEPVASWDNFLSRAYESKWTWPTLKIFSACSSDKSTGNSSIIFSTSAYVWIHAATKRSRSVAPSRSANFTATSHSQNVMTFPWIALEPMLGKSVLFFLFSRAGVKRTMEDWIFDSFFHLLNLTYAVRNLDSSVSVYLPNRHAPKAPASHK